jgi:uncharacterized protein YuzE
MEKTMSKNKRKIVKLPSRKIVNSSYDEEADVLYISFGKPKASEVHDTGEDLLIRFDPATGEITGFTILNFSSAKEDIEELIRTKRN